MKTCSRCKEVKPLAAFTPRSERPAGQFSPHCKACKAAQARARRAALGEEYRAYKRARYNADPQKERDRSNAYKELNRDKEREKSRAYIKANRARMTALQVARQAMAKQATPAWANRDDIRMFYEVAEVLSRGGVKFHVDHTVPINSGLVCGLHVEANLQVLPWYVNLAKSNSRWPDMPQ